MLVQPTLDTLNRLKLYGMAAALSEQLTQSAAMGLAFDERLALLLDREVVHRDNRRLARLLQLAQLKQRACIEDIDYRARRGLDRSQLTSLASCDWIRCGQNLLIHGATGCGKTFLACALAQQGLSAGAVRALPARAAAVRRTQRLPRRRQLPQAPRRHRQSRPRPDRRLRHRPDGRARAHRLARTARRSCRHPLHAHHQPASG
jgi:hypothetical protein